MKRVNWIERTKMNFVGIIDTKRAERLWKKENKYDNLLLKDLNVLLKQFYVKLRLERYEDSPFSANSIDVVPIILKYVDMCERKINKAHLLSTLRSPYFCEAVPYLINFYKDLLKNYSTPEDESILLSVCETIEKIDSDRYICQYIDLLNMSVTPSAECIINMLSKMPCTPQIEATMLSLVERENLIPKIWVGKPNETDKYWCSQIALSYIVKMANANYQPLIEQFLTPQNLSWIHFTESEYCKYNYSYCYKQYINIVSKYIRK